jgi:glycosyltransferase involved in cell wall biosynthesis
MNEFEVESEELSILDINNDTTVVNEIDIKYNIPKNGIRLHILGLPHTITRDEYSHCAYTGKIQRFSPMMRSVGYEVYHYGVETSDSGADKNIDVLSLEEWNKLRIISYKVNDFKLTDEEIVKKINDPASFVGDLGNHDLPLYKEFNKRLSQILDKTYRSKATDIVCLPFGYGHWEAIKNKDFVIVESGIGYPITFCNFRIFESYAWLHYMYGTTKNYNVSNYNFVVPNYFDSKIWKLNLTPKKNTVGFFGRIYDGKGVHIIVEIAKRFPDIDFIICGQGDPMPYLKHANIIYKPPIHGNERSEYLGSLSAIIAPTTWIEPFCGVAVEAQLCGTPVLTTDYGAQTETVEPFKTGLHCHTLADYCYGVQMALDGKFDREYIYKRAVEKYDMYKIAKKYDYCFKSILDISNGKNGWYAEKSHLPLLE